MHAQAEGPPLTTRDVRVEEFGGRVKVEPLARWLRVPLKTNLRPHGKRNGVPEASLLVIAWPPYPN